MKRSFVITLAAMLTFNGCATIDKGLVIGLIESVVASSIEYLREHPESIRASLPLTIDASASLDASAE